MLSATRVVGTVVGSGQSAYTCLAVLGGGLVLPSSHIAGCGLLSASLSLTLMWVSFFFPLRLPSKMWGLFLS